MSYFDNKNLSKETILFIHGLSVSKEIFYKQFIDLQNDFHIIAIDLLGHGESENSADKIKSLYSSVKT